jgi:transposase
MMGIKRRTFCNHSQINLEHLVPQDNFYRKLEAKLDLSFTRDLVQHLYRPYGRPSVDPIVFFKLQLIMFFEAIRSERLLMKTVPMRLDQRWYLGYDLDEELPYHSSLSKIRERYSITIFHKFFEHIVELCIDAGLVWGEEVFFDGSMIYANANAEAQVPQFYWQAVQEHLDETFEAQSEWGATQSQIPPLVERYSDAQNVSKKSSYKRKADQWTSPIDPNASSVGHQKLGYRLHYVVDGGRSRIILNCLVSPAAIRSPVTAVQKPLTSFWTTTSPPS